MTLPRLTIPYAHYELRQDPDGTWSWCEKNVEVEVCSLNIRTGTMRVRTVAKIRIYPEAKPETASWNASIAPFWERYELREKDLKEV